MLLGTKGLAMKAEILNRLTNFCIHDLCKFYGRGFYLNTVVNMGRRGDSLAANILNCYSPTILANAFKQLPEKLDLTSDNIIRRNLP